MNSETFYKKYIEKDFEEYYVSHMFENICRQFLIRENRAGRIEPVIEKTGKYYYDDPKNRTNGEFDIVTEDENGYAFYEVKFRKKQVSNEVIDEEISQVEVTGLNCYKYVFFSRSGFNCDKRDNVELINLSDIFVST